MSETLTIARLGRQGDGIAATDAGPVYVPFALSGETVAVSGKGARRRLDRVVTASTDRRPAICRHFGACGGCQLQHFDPPAYREWKRGLVVEALARSGIEADVLPLATFPTASRRRAVFSMARSAKGIVFGFMERDSDRIVDLGECPVLLAQLGERLDGLRALAGAVAPGRGQARMTVLACANGLDVCFSTASRPGDRAIGKAIGLASELGLARLSLDGEILAEFRRPQLRCGLALVTPPPGAFAQAVEEAEATMAGLVVSHLGDCRRVADLYSGYGAFALRLGEHCEVVAAETDGPALEALDRAWRETGGRLKRISGQRRDLERRPFMASELKPFDGVVFDPPRAGAERQCRELAASGVRRIAAVSCNPVTLARDLGLLIDGGYRLASVTPIDQFVFTPHVETVALLERRG